jgi:hypothetical protein
VYDIFPIAYCLLCTYYSLLLVTLPVQAYHILCHNNTGSQVAPAMLFVFHPPRCHRRPGAMVQGEYPPPTFVILRALVRPARKSLLIAAFCVVPVAVP